MRLIGCDLHASQQSIAMLDRDTGAVIEKTMIEHALRQASGRISGANGAAAILGMPRQTLESKLRRLGIKPYHFRTS